MADAQTRSPSAVIERYKVCSLFQSCWKCGDREARKHASVSTSDGLLIEVGRYCSPCSAAIGRRLDRVGTVEELQALMAEWNTQRDALHDDWRQAW